VLAAELGDGWHVIEEGLGGRTTVFDDPLEPDRNGRTYFLPCLLSHEPLDLVVIALGTNDLKARFSASGSDIARGIAVLAQLALDSRVGPGAESPKVLLLGLPALGPLDDRADELAGGAEKAVAIRPYLRAWAEALGVELLELHDLVSYSDRDGFHLEAEAHRVIGAAVARRVQTVFA
jgi:lysophospholipase L1-like esterase